MKIGIDIDDTITESGKVIKEFCYKYDKDYSDNNLLINSINDIMRGFLKDDIVKQFFNDHCVEICNTIELKDNVKEVIDKLRNEGNKIYLITARSDKFYGDARYHTSKYLENKNINYDVLSTGQTFKVEYCKQEGIDLMIDDAIDTVENMKENGINSLLFTSEINKDKETSVKRVNNWLEVYDIIHNMN